MWTALRIAGWFIGIYALLKLATLAGGVTYAAVFQAWLDSLRDILDLGFILRPLAAWAIQPMLEFLRGLGFAIPPLQDHWQQVFVLTWLLAAAVARNLSFSETSNTPWQYLRTRNLSLGVSTPVALGLAFVCTLPFCVAAGTVPVGSPAVIAWPLVGYSTFLVITALLRRAWLRVLIDTALLAGGAGFAIAAYSYRGYLLPTVEGTNWLRILAFIVWVYGLFLLWSGLFDRQGDTFGQRLQHPYAATGLDITAVLLGAFGLATVFADPPLF